MKRKRFYNNKKRNQKWTEKEKGRKIDFSDKYITDGSSSDKFDNKRPKSANHTAKKKAKTQKTLKHLLIAVLCLAVISVGYTGMDVYMTRHERSALNDTESKSQTLNNMAEISINFVSYKTDSVSLDSSVMLSSVINEAENEGFTSITFDAKRSDGTIGYTSGLASIDTFSAVSSPASKPASSVKELLANDILPIARISCYKDNVVPKMVSQAAVLKGDKLYTDNRGNNYLNPDSEIAYNYIRDIIQELSGMGITVFVLNECNLPKDISDNYNDGFDALSKKLYSDLDSNIKLIEEIDVAIDGRDPKTGKTTNSAIKNDIRAFRKTTAGQAYYISTKISSKKLIDQLDKNNITNCIIDN